MFGYLRPYKPELKIREFSLYKTVYCGLCEAIGKRYGFIMRNVLSYDATLFCLLGLSMQPGCQGFEQRHCPIKPFKKCDMAKRNDEIDFWADVSVMLAYYKLQDNMHDEKLAKRAVCLLAFPFVSSAYKRAVKNNAAAADCLRQYIAEQSAVEAKNSPSIDEAAQPTATLLARLLTCRTADEKSKRILERMGVFLGRWIYICDAADDYDADLKSGGYNPFVTFIKNHPEQGKTQSSELAEPLLNSCIYEVTSAFELLEPARYRAIVANTFYFGLPEVKKAVLSGLPDREKRKRFHAIYQI